MKSHEGHWHAIVFLMILCVAAYNLVTAEPAPQSSLLNHPLLFASWLGTSTVIVLYRSELKVRSDFWYMNEPGKKNEIRLERKRQLRPLGLAAITLLVYSIRWLMIV